MGKNTQNWREANAAKSNAGFAAFRQGKELYFAFIKAHGEGYGIGKDDDSLATAYEYYQTAVRGAQEDKRFADVARTHVELGKICELQGNAPQSVEHRRKAIDLLEALPQLKDDDKESIRDSYMFLAISLFHCGEKEEAEKAARLGIKKYTAANDPYGIKPLQTLISNIENDEDEPIVWSSGNSNPVGSAKPLPLTEAGTIDWEKASSTPQMKVASLTIGTGYFYLVAYLWYRAFGIGEASWQKIVLASVVSLPAVFIIIGTLNLLMDKLLKRSGK